MKIIVIPTQELQTLKWGLWSNKYQGWMHKTPCKTKRGAIAQAKRLGFQLPIPISK